MHVDSFTRHEYFFKQRSDDDSDLDSNDDLIYYDEYVPTSALLIAVEQNNAQLVKLLVQYGADLEAKVCYSETVLFRAVRMRKLRVITELLRQGANVNTRDRSGQTPLFEAVRQRNVKMISLLLDYGASACKTDHVHNKVLHDVMCEYMMFVRVTIGKRGKFTRLVEIIKLLIPLAKNYEEVYFLESLRREQNQSPYNLEISKLLLMHGYALPYPGKQWPPDDPYLWKRPSLGYKFEAMLENLQDDYCFYSKWRPDSLPRPHTDEFFTAAFLRLCQLAGVSFKGVMHKVQLDLQQGLPEHLQLLEPFLTQLVELLSVPEQLQSLCIKVVRKALRGPPRLWQKIDRLPLTAPLKDSLKLMHECPGRHLTWEEVEEEKRDFIMLAAPFIDYSDYTAQ